MRGMRLAVQAYRSRRRREPPPIVRASFQRGDVTLVEYTAEELEAASFRPLKPKSKRAKPKPKPKLARRPALNAIGRPFSPQYDPAYRLKHKPGQMKRACAQTGDLFSLEVEAVR
jgi:hypothetical protein